MGVDALGQVDMLILSSKQMRTEIFRGNGSILACQHGLTIACFSNNLYVSMYVCTF
jgi:hypothetical protein